MKMHPEIKDAVIIRANQLGLGDLVYSAHGWMNGPRDYDGCWRRVIEIGENPGPGHDFWAKLECFPGEPASMVEWYDYHTLLIIRKRQKE